MGKLEYQPKNWSFSALHNYESCALQYVLNKTERVEQAPSYALEFGLKCHDLMENFLKDEIQGVPRELQMFETELNNLKHLGALAEEALVLDKNWEQVTGPEPWWSKKAYIRAKLDARIDQLFIDLKTGREYGHYDEQADLYATMLFEIYPAWDVIEGEFWYTKSGEVVPYVFERKDHAKRLASWKAREKKLMSEKHWLPSLNSACKWCAYQDRCEIFDG